MARKKTAITLALGTAFAASLAAAPIVKAADNPFQMDALSKGYQVADNKPTEGKCGEGKCGEGKCGGDKAKDKDKEGKCGEGKCGEGKCGGAK
jgi:uncharacterized low-complexity protein